MRPTLFIVCPFSDLEHFLRRAFANQILFLSAAGGIVRHRELECCTAIETLLRTRPIGTICVVNERSCPLINAVIQRKKRIANLALESLEELYLEHLFTDFHQHPLVQQQCRLAELNVKRQINHLLASPLLSPLIKESAVAISGLVTSCKHKLIHEITTGTNNSVHEP